MFSGLTWLMSFADDLYLNPIAGVELYILGRESQRVFTDAQGRFSFTHIPAGRVKLGVQAAVVQAQDRRATQVRAHADRDEQIGPQRARWIDACRWLLGAPGKRVCQGRIVLLQRVHHRLAAPHHPYRPAAPGQRLHLAR